MGLPIFQSGDQIISLLQSAWARRINPVLDNPMSRGIILENITLNNGTTQINHTLGREIKGWQIIRLRAPATIYDTQDSNPLRHLTLSIVSNAVVSVDLFVF